MNISQRDPVPKTGKPKKDRAHLAKVGALPCCICHEYGLQQLSRTQVHHCKDGMHNAFRKSSDLETIPLCEGHHQGLRDTSKIAFHQDRHEWNERYGEDTRWISWVEKRLGKDEA
jgi:hypothetical protein